MHSKFLCLSPAPVVEDSRMTYQGVWKGAPASDQEALELFKSVDKKADDVLSFAEFGGLARTVLLTCFYLFECLRWCAFVWRTDDVHRLAGRLPS